MDNDSTSGFNDKLRHLYLHEKNPYFTLLSDKLEVKEYIREYAPELKTAAVHHITKLPSSLPFDSFPDRYVIKPNHLSGIYFIVKDERVESGHSREKMKFDKKRIINECRDWLELDISECSGELWYGDIERFIFVEEYIDNSYELKFHCFHGKIAMVEHVHPSEFHKRGWYTTQWKKLQISDIDEVYDGVFDMPSHFDQLKTIVEKLSQGIKFCRIDILVSNTEFIFGEFTFAPMGFNNEFEPYSFEEHLGKFVDNSVEQAIITKYMD